MTDQNNQPVPQPEEERGTAPLDPWRTIDGDPAAWKKILTLMAIAIGLIGLWLISGVSYLLFHSVVEAFSVLVAGGIFTVAWNTRRYVSHGFFLVLGVGILGVSAIDFLHLLAYKGMGVFPGSTADLATQLWVAARYLQAGSMLLAPLFLTRKAQGVWLLPVYGLATALLLAMVFGGWFPACFIEGQGLTRFKMVSEYLICGLISGGMVLVYRRRQWLDPRIGHLVMAALGLSIAAELAFTLYADVYGLSNQIGHVLKIAAYWSLYQGVTVTGLRRPYQTLFQDLAQRENRYRMLFDNMTEGFALHEIIIDERGRPGDYRFLDVNYAFERLTGLKRTDLIGRRVLEALPGTEPYWIETYGHVALQGDPVHFERFFPPLNRWYQVFAYRPQIGRFATIFTDITERKKIEEDSQAFRLAALNLMEDAVEARQEAEQISAELEARVQERTADLFQTVQALQEEIYQREIMEETLRASEQRVRYFTGQCLTAQEQERKRIAAELHDSLASTLVAVKYRIEKAISQAGLESEVYQSLQDLVAVVGTALQEVRRIMVALRPAMLDDLGIIPALNWFCREFEKTYDYIRVEKQIGLSECEVADAWKTPIFRLTQEALNNIAKHSLASLATISLSKVNGRIVLVIRDNGRGFEPGEVVKGLGLSTMKERTEFSGGNYRLESSPGEGTALVATWPCEG
jgi:PAS domain S-box-containing protein